MESYYSITGLIKEGSQLRSIGIAAFQDCSNLTKIVIPSSVESIEQCAFIGCSSLTIYCEATLRPSGWNFAWNYFNIPVYWAGKWEYNENGEPVPLIK